MNKAEEYGVDENPLLVLKESCILEVIKKRFNKDLLFDAKGFEIEYNKDFENDKCKGNILQLISGLGKETFISRDSSSTLFKESEFWHLMDSDPNNFTLQSYLQGVEYDYYLVSYWNTFSGKQNNQNRIQDINTYVKNNSRIKLKILFVNQDFREEMTTIELSK
ncbi:MAG: hypothetical protein R2850_12235 [Bacteroidia bacterium]